MSETGPGFALVNLVPLLAEVLQVGKAAVDFAAICVAAENAQVDLFDPALVLLFLLENLVGQRLSFSYDQRAVHHEEGLGSDRGGGALAVGGCGIAEVEERIESGQIGTAQRQIDATPIGLLGIHADAIGAGFAVGSNARIEGAAHRQIEVATEGEIGITDFFDAEALARIARVEAVFRVFCVGCFIEDSAHLICAGEHDHTVYLLDGPAAVDEGFGQIIEEFGVVGTLAETAKIIGGADDAVAKVALPNTVGHYTGGQRIAGVDEPVGKFKATAFGLDGRAGGVEAEDCRNGALDRVSEIVIVASYEDLLIHRLAFDNSASHWDFFGWQCVFDLCRFGQQYLYFA